MKRIEKWAIATLATTGLLVAGAVIEYPGDTGRHMVGSILTVAGCLAGLYLLRGDKPTKNE
jgi:hypothetical protein